MNNFIEVYKNAFTKEYCEKVIKYFENMKNSGFGLDRMQNNNLPKHVADDVAVRGHGENEINLYNTQEVCSEFNSIFSEIFQNHYSSKYSILRTCGPHRNYAYKAQKTEIGSGFHIWHAENIDKASSHRILVWMVYLNDVEEGGETEFLYQQLRLKPEQGTLVIFPAAFTHVHRGNPPLSNEKYIITGWVEF